MNIGSFAYKPMFVVVCVYTRQLMPVRALAYACTGVGSCLYGRWLMPVQALAHACTGVGGTVSSLRSLITGTIASSTQRLPMRVLRSAVR